MTAFKNAAHSKRLEQSLFLVPQKWQLENIAKLDAEMTYVSNREAAQKSEAIAVDRNSLVKRGESPTDKSKLSFAELYEHEYREKKVKLRKRAVAKQSKKTEQLSRIKQNFEKNVFTCPEPVSLKSRAKTPLRDYLKIAPRNTIAKDTKTCVRMFSQSWAGKYKFSLVTGALGAKVVPPETSGERITKELTKNASRHILESGAYLSATRAGYSTFLTLTFDDKSRQDLEKLIAIRKNKAKVYERVALGNREISTMGNRYEIICYSGVPFCLGDTDEIKTATRYSNAIESSGAFTPVTFEPKTTIGKEVSRFFDGAQKKYQRGFVPESITETREYPWGKVKCQQPNSKKIEPAYVMYCPDIVSKKTPSGEIPLGFENAFDFEKYNPRKHTDSNYLENKACFGERQKSAPLDYMWVAEQPINDKGEKNPHVHVLMRWRVEPELFQSWAKGIEKLWGHGFAKLERIKTPEAASNYLLKAVGYLTKGSSNDQGEIKGNRYGISASARAPKWECIGEFYADNFIAILGELREKLERKKAIARSKINAKINSQAMQKGKIAKLANVNKSDPSEARKAFIDKLKKELIDTDKSVAAAQDYVNQLPFINEFAIGGMNETQATDFLSWAMRERWWNSEVKTNRYSHWQELKQNTVKAIAENRRHFKGCAHLLETRDLTWVWAENDSRFEPVEMRENTFVDDDGIEWERVA